MIAFLPKYVLLNLLKDWLYLLDIGKLDAALCNFESRSFFHSHLNHCELNFCREYVDCSELSLISWIVSRNLSFSSLILEEKFNQKPSVCDLFHNRKMNNVRHLAISCGAGYKSIDEIVARANYLESLEILNASKIDFYNIQPILSVCGQNLHTLTLSDVDVLEWTFENINNFASSCSQITEFNLLKYSLSPEATRNLIDLMFYQNDALLSFKLFVVPEYFVQVDEWLAAIHSVPSFVEAKALCYIPMGQLDTNIDTSVIVWEKQKSKFAPTNASVCDTASCDAADTYLITATACHPFSAMDYLLHSHVSKKIILSGYDNSRLFYWAYFDGWHRVTHLEINNCNIWQTDFWFHRCSVLVQISIKDSPIILQNYVSHVTINMLPALNKIRFVDNSFLNVENWLSALLQGVTNALKIVEIIVPKSEMHIKLNNSIINQLTEMVAVIYKERLPQ